LDEPSIGLDIFVKEKLRRFIKYVNQKHNTTIILTSHDLDDIEQICNRVIFLDKGNIILDSNLSDIKKSFDSGKQICFDIKNKTKSFESYIQEKKLNYKILEDSENRIEIIVTTKDYKVSSIIKEIEAVSTINDIKIKEENLESLVKKIYGK